MRARQALAATGRINGGMPSLVEKPIRQKGARGNGRLTAHPPRPWGSASQFSASLAGFRGADILVGWRALAIAGGQECPRSFQNGNICPLCTSNTPASVITREKRRDAGVAKPRTTDSSPRFSTRSASRRSVRFPTVPAWPLRAFDDLKPRHAGEATGGADNLRSADCASGRSVCPP